MKRKIIMATIGATLLISSFAYASDINSIYPEPIPPMEGYVIDQTFPNSAELEPGATLKESPDPEPIPPMEGYVIDQTFPNSAELEPGANPKAGVVTESTVSRYATTISGQTEYYAEGYVTVMQGTSPYPHSTTVLLEDKRGNVVVTKKETGSGKVSAKTGTTPDSTTTPRIFWDEI